MKCLYEFKQSKLKSEIINLLQAEIADIDFNVKENRKKVSQCNIFFGSMLLGGEITPKQFMSIVAMDSYVQDQTLDLLTFMKGHERRRFCCQVEQNGFDIDDLFNLHQKRQTYLLPGSKKCIICDFRNNVRQMFVRNENKLLVVAKKRAVDWKSMNDLLPYKMKLFCFNYDGMRLSIHFSNDAQSYLYMEKDLPPIDIHVSFASDVLLINIQCRSITFNSTYTQKNKLALNTCSYSVQIVMRKLNDLLQPKCHQIYVTISLQEEN